jgi:hypothetical protein
MARNFFCELADFVARRSRTPHQATESRGAPWLRESRTLNASHAKAG